jgi:chromosome segregation ATPase
MKDGMPGASTFHHRKEHGMTITEEPATTITEENSVRLTTEDTAETTELASAPRSTLLERVEQLKREAEAHRAILQESMNDRESLRGRLERLEQELIADRNSIGLLTAQRGSLQGRVEDVTAERDALLAREVDITADRESLQERLNYLSQRLDDVKMERDSLERRLSQVGLELEAFKEKVAEVASRYADDHGWCGVIDAALEELGLERRPATYLATLTITVDFRADLRARRELPDRSWVEQSVQTDTIRRAIENSFGLDSDHTSSSVEEVEFDVSDVRSAHNDD